MKVRIISGLIGIGVFVATMFAAVNISPLIFHVLLAAVGCIGVYEALKATGYVKSKFLIVSSIVYAAITPFVYSIELLEAEFNLNLLIRHEACLVVYAAVIFTAAMLKHKSISPMQVTYTFSATIAITFAFWSLAAVFSMNDGHGLFYILLVFLMAWICDTGAYFTGYFFGKHKLAPEISPKKTIEGAIGGVVTDVLVMFVSCLIFNTLTENTANMPLIVGVAPIFAVAGMMGDLIFSYIKRDCKIKDYGNIMPGHGGVLDRFDSVIVIAPLMYLLITHFPFVI